MSGLLLVACVVGAMITTNWDALPFGGSGDGPDTDAVPAPSVSATSSAVPERASDYADWREAALSLSSEFERYDFVLDDAIVRDEGDVILFEDLDGGAVAVYLYPDGSIEAAAIGPSREEVLVR